MASEQRPLKRKRSPPSLNVTPRAPKRKFLYTTDTSAPKKGRFQYINKNTTKPRRLKPRTSNASTAEIVPNVKINSAKSTRSGNLFLAHHSQRVDLFYEDEQKCNSEAAKKLDLSYHITDEIALEGLDGVTLEAFWKRLKNVFPNHIIKPIADKIWRLICNNKHINCYILKEPREKLVSFDRCKHLDIEAGIFVDPFVEFKDIYPFASINGGDVRGSCSTYESRKENNGVRKFTMEKAMKLYDQKLVFVADQALRNKALINDETDPNLELMDIEYCMLERIGRSREQGEISQGKSITAGILNDKSVYHHRKILVQNNLISNQPLCLKSFTTQQLISGGLTQLPRFYKKRKTKQFAAIERIAKTLREIPTHQMEWSLLRSTFEQCKWLPKLVKSPEFRKFFKILIYPYRKLYPNALRHEYMSKSLTKEREVRVIKMLDPFVNVAQLLDIKEIKEDEEKSLGSSLGRKLMNCEFLHDIFWVILESGSVGLTVNEINKLTKMDYYSVRSALRKLEAKHVISSYKIDLGRQQSKKFIAKCPANIIPSIYELDSETLDRVLKPYENLPESTEFCNGETQVQVPKSISVNVLSETTLCPCFITDNMDISPDSITIYDIILKGLDRLLLIQSNLFDHFISEWDDFVLRKKKYFTGVNMMTSGLSAPIYDLLQELDLSKFDGGSGILYSAEDLRIDTRISKITARTFVEFRANYRNPHSNYAYIDTVGKIYLFERLLKQGEVPVNTINHMKEIFLTLDPKGKTPQSIVGKKEPNFEIEVSSAVVMEKYMGADPVLEHSFCEGDIKIDFFSSTPPAEVKKYTGSYHSDDVNLTARFLYRVNVILKLVYEKSIVKDIATLLKEIRNSERNEGYDKTMCKKSLVSLVLKIATEGYLKVYKVLITKGNTMRSQIFFCKPEITYEHTMIMAIVEQMKLKFYSGTAQTKRIKIKKKESPFSFGEIKASISLLRRMCNTKLEKKFTLKVGIGREYGYSPKFKRTKILHELMFYIIRDLPEVDELPVSDREILFAGMDITEGIPAVYKKEISWKMFIPPLARTARIPKGWALACDIILRMPINIFVMLYNVPYELPEFERLLNHPVKKYFLVKQLPSSIVHALLFRRKFFHHIYDSIRDLCYLGLIQLGPRNFREKDQVFIYLNTKAQLLDTTTSAVNYNRTEIKKYDSTLFEFKSLKNIEDFWTDMLRICLNTPLGKKKGFEGQYITVENSNFKPGLVVTTRAKNFAQAPEDDVGNIPGDGRGAAGFDSSLWTFLKKNWYWMSSTAPKSAGKPKPKCEPIRHQQALKAVVVKRGVNKVKKIITKKQKRPREYYDLIDKGIMLKNGPIRVDWVEQEDKFIRYLRVASTFLCPKIKKQSISYTVVRDVLHRICPISKNKTSKAIQRRVHVLLTRDESLNIMETNAANLLNSDNIFKYFAQVRNRRENDVKLSDTQIHVVFIFLMSYIVKHQKEVDFFLHGYVATFDYFSPTNIEAVAPLIVETNGNGIRNPETAADILKSTAKSVIHSSMVCRKTMDGWSFYLGQIYKKFNEDLIRFAVKELRQSHSFVLNKNNRDRGMTSGLPFPLKFSYLYKVVKQSTYTLEMYHEAFEHFDKLLHSTERTIDFVTNNEVCSRWENVNFDFEIPEMSIILNPEIEDHSEVIDELAKRFLFYLEKIHKKQQDGLQEEKIEVTSQGQNLEELKKNVQNLIFRVPYLFEGELEEDFKLMVGATEESRINEYISSMISRLKSLISNQRVEEFVGEIDDRRLLKSLSKVVFGIQAIHQGKCEIPTDIDAAFSQWEQQLSEENLENDQVPIASPRIKNPGTGLEVCIKRAQNGDFPTIDEIKVGMMDHSFDARTIPHITDLVTFLNEGRFPELNADYEMLDKMKEHFIVQYPKLQNFTIEQLEDFRGQKCVQRIFDKEKYANIKKRTINVIKSARYDHISNFLRKNGYSNNQLEIMENLMELIKETKEIGVLATAIKEGPFGNIAMYLVQLLDFLADMGLIIRTGISAIVYVHHEYQNNWTSETYVVPPEERAAFPGLSDVEILRSMIGDKLEAYIQKVQLKPWTLLDGSLNLPLFKEWLCIILSKCMEFPGIQFGVLSDHFFSLTPVDVYRLLEILQDLGCVEMWSYKKTEQSLFGSRECVEETPATCLDHFETIYIKPNSMSALLFGNFLCNDGLYMC